MFNKNNDHQRVSLDNDHFKCDVHEALHIYLLVRVFLEADVLPRCSDQCVSFRALCAVLDLLQCVKHEGRVSVATLRDAVFGHLRSFMAAYSEHGWIPKHHLAIHLCDALQRHGTLIGCLVHERRHKIVKRWSRDRYTTKSFERGLLEELTVEHMHAMKEDWCIDDRSQTLWSEPRKAMSDAIKHEFPDTNVVHCANMVRANGAAITAGDVAFADIGGRRQLVEAWFHARVDKHVLSCVSVWPHAPSASDTCITETYRRAEDPRFLPTACLLCSAIYLQIDGFVTAIVPAELRV